MEKGEKRDSNFELLRIVAIIMIIMHHYFIHGNCFETIENNNITLNLILSKILNFGNSHIFILLTGYFMIKSTVKYKKIISLILEMLFYSLTIFCIFCGFNIIKFDLKSFIKSLFPIFWGNWFIVYYIILYLLMPYINLFIEKINKNQLKKLIFVLAILYFVVPTFTKNAWNFTSHDLFILDYLIGAYIRLYPTEKFNDNKFNIKCLLTIVLLTIISILGLIFIGSILNIDKLITSSNYLVRTIYSIVSLLIAIFIFLVFKNIKIRSKKINYISSSVLGIYLIHDNFIVSPWLWNKFWPNINFLNSNLFILHIFAKVILVFVVCLIIDKIRIILFQKVENKLSDKIFNLILKIKEKVKILICV